MVGAPAVFEANATIRWLCLAVSADGVGMQADAGRLACRDVVVRPREGSWNAGWRAGELVHGAFALGSRVVLESWCCTRLSCLPNMNNLLTRAIVKFQPAAQPSHRRDKVPNCGYGSCMAA